MIAYEKYIQTLYSHNGINHFFFLQEKFTGYRAYNYSFRRSNMEGPKIGDRRLSQYV